MIISKDTKYVILVGQDGSTYHQYIFSKKGWKGPEGHTFILPKGEGEVLMISGFQSREIGLGLNDVLTYVVMKAVNGKIKGTKYIACEDEKLINGSE